MKCPKCSKAQLDIVNSRKNETQRFVWRRRKCPACGFSFTTHEQFFLDDTLLISEARALRPYRQSLLLAALLRACDHLPTSDSAFWLARTIESALLAKTKNDTDAKKLIISQHALHAVVLEVLDKFDHISAIKYAAQAGVTIPL